jgi:hypothetical protein
MSINSPRLICQQSLPNGLTLELWDHSRPVAGDRWYTCLETRIAIPVRADDLPPDLKPLADEVVAALGPEIVFSHQEDRNFVAASAQRGLLKDMQDRILALAPGYLGHGNFAAGCIRGKFAARQKQEHWQRLDTRRDDGA